MQLTKRCAVLSISHKCKS